VRDAALRGADASTTWLREAAVRFFANAPPGVQFDAGVDRSTVFARRRLLETAQRPPSEGRGGDDDAARAALAAAVAAVAAWNSTSAFAPAARAAALSTSAAAAAAAALAGKAPDGTPRRLDATRRQLSWSPGHPAARAPASYARGEYVAALLASRFCLHLQGDTTTSRRLFDAVAAGCIPVIVADGVNLPFSAQVGRGLRWVRVVPQTFGYRVATPNHIIWL
jgi:hypothetical protein